MGKIMPALRCDFSISGYITNLLKTRIKLYENVFPITFIDKNSFFIIVGNFAIVNYR